MCLLVVDVGLGAIDDTDDAEFDRNDSAEKNINGVGSVIHQIELRQYYQSSSAYS